MFGSNEGPPILLDRIYKYFWGRGPDGKFYPTPEGLRRAKEEWLKSKLLQTQPTEKKIIKKEKPPKLHEYKPPESLPDDLLDKLTGLDVDEFRAVTDFLTYFLNSFPPPPTSSTE